MKNQTMSNGKTIPFFAINLSIKTTASKFPMKYQTIEISLISFNAAYAGRELLNNITHPTYRSRNIAISFPASYVFSSPQTLLLT